MAGSESLIRLQTEGLPTAVISIPPPCSAPVLSLLPGTVAVLGAL